jgi:Ca-activated chloride channel homolog
MLVRDAEPSRLAWARTTALALVRELGDVPVGIVVFAGRAYALSPPTRDAGAVGLYLDALDPQMITQTGSALSGALRQGVGLLLAGEAEGGVMVLISDGNTADDPAELEAAVDLARRGQVPVIAVGVGTARGGPVPDLDPVTGERLGYKREADGQVVESHLAEEVLEAIAAGTGGSYLPAVRAPAARLAALVRSGSGRGGGTRMEGPPRFAWFAGLALLLLVCEGALWRGKGSV